MGASDSLINLPNTDFQHVLRICEKLHQADPAQSFIHHCHDTLNQAFSQVHISLKLYQLEAVKFKDQEIHTPDHNAWVPVFKEHAIDHSFAEQMFTLISPQKGMTDRNFSLKESQKSVRYNEFYDQADAQNQVWVGLSDRDQLLCCIYSRETEYTEEELAMMCIIQSHLETAWKNWRRSHAFKQELDWLKESLFQSEEEKAATDQLRRRFDALTDRQRDVAELVAQGQDNQQIADVLKISILTVKKHMQRVFQFLEVHHRTQLASKWYQAYSVRLF